MENRRPKNQQIGRSKIADVGCKKHPKHRQSPGVCSVCLRERLSQLPKSSRNNTTAMASSSSSSSCTLSSLSSHYSSSESSPIHHRYSLVLETKVSMSFFRSGKNVLTKSRSMASVPPEGEGRDGKKKGGFWSKLLRPRSKKIDGGGLAHSRTMRERVVITTRVH